MNPREDFYAAMNAVLAAVPRDDSSCPLCHCEHGQMHAETCPLARLGTIIECYGPQIVESVEPRCECVLTIDRHLLSAMLRSEGRLALWCCDLPTDAQIVGVDTSERHEDFLRNRPVKLVIESATFDPVLPHERPHLWGLGQTYRKGEEGGPG